MTTGQGGMVTTDDTQLAEKIASLRNHGLDSNAWNRYSAEGRPFYTVGEPGFNYGMTDLQASIGLGQLARLGEFNAARTRLAARYTERFDGLSEIETPTVRPDVTSNWHLYVIRLSNLAISRDRFIEELRAMGIGSAVHYYPVHYHDYYRERFGFKKGDYPVAEAEFERLVSLPLFPMMKETDVDRVVTAVEAIVAANRA
jgi:dTDP-4-amino-4,6-dideoxygalactose transaminase